MLDCAPDAKRFLIGNIVDSEERRVISEEEAKKFANEYCFDLFMEVSSITGYNCDKIFKEAAILLYKDYKRYNESYNLELKKIKKKNKNWNAKKKCV